MAAIARSDQMNHDIADDLTAKMADQPDRIPDYLNLLFYCAAPRAGR